MSKTSTQPPPTGFPSPLTTQLPAQTSNVSYPSPSGFPWKCIAAMIREDNSHPGCHYNHPKDSPRIKFHQEVGFPALAKHGYLCRKDFTASKTIVDQFNTKFPKITDQFVTSKPMAKRVSYEKAYDHVSARQVHSPSIPIPPIDSSVPPASPEKNLLLLPNQAAPMPTFDGYANLYSSDS